MATHRFLLPSLLVLSACGDGSSDPTPPPPPVNLAPTASIKASATTVDEGTEFELDGSTSSDPDGDTLTYQWTQTGGPDATLSAASGASITVTAPLVDADDTLTFELAVSDGALSDATTVSIDVSDVPPLSAGEQGFDVMGSRADVIVSTDPAMPVDVFEDKLVIQEADQLRFQFVDVSTGTLNDPADSDPNNFEGLTGLSLSPDFQLMDADRYDLLAVNRQTGQIRVDLDGTSLTFTVDNACAADPIVQDFATTGFATQLNPFDFDGLVVGTTTGELKVFVQPDRNVLSFVEGPTFTQKGAAFCDILASNRITRENYDPTTGNQPDTRGLDNDGKPILALDQLTGQAVLLRARQNLATGVPDLTLVDQKEVADVDGEELLPIDTLVLQSYLLESVRGFSGDPGIAYVLTNSVPMETLNHRLVIVGKSETGIDTQTLFWTEGMPIKVSQAALRPTNTTTITPNTVEQIIVTTELEDGVVFELEGDDFNYIFDQPREQPHVYQTEAKYIFLGTGAEHLETDLNAGFFVTYPDSDEVGLVTIQEAE